MPYSKSIDFKRRRKKKLEAIIWLNHAGGRAWRCETCTTSQRRLRGNCGGSFKPGVKHGIQDERGRVYVPGYRIAPDSDPDWADYHFYSCPVAGANQAAGILNYYHYTKNNMISIADVIPNPTPAFLDAIAVLNNASELRELRIRKQNEDLNNG